MIITPTGAHADAIEALAAATELFTPDELEAFSAFLSETLVGDDKTAWFAATDGASKVVGAAAIQDELMGDGVANLLFIGVAPAARRNGHAAALLAAAEAAARQKSHRLVLIETASGPAQAPARTFYGAAGYDHEASIRDFYAPGADKLIFRKAL